MQVRAAFGRPFAVHVPTPWFGGSFLPIVVLCSGFLAASAGVAKLIGLAVSSRTEQHHSSSDAAGHRQTDLLP